MIELRIEEGKHIAKFSNAEGAGNTFPEAIALLVEEVETQVKKNISFQNETLDRLRADAVELSKEFA